MHQPNLHPNPSSYFNYQVYPFARPAEMDASAGASSTHPVAIVGAGPIGLVLAILLAKQGVKVTLIESEAQAQASCMATGDFRRAFEAFVADGNGDTDHSALLLHLEKINHREEDRK